MKPGITAPAWTQRLLGERQLQVGELRVERVDRVADPEAEIDRDLVVARARRVQPPGRRADQLGKPRFDVHVNVFERAREREGPGLDFGLAPGLDPRAMAAASAGSTMPASASIATWAFEPAMSWPARR